MNRVPGTCRFLVVCFVIASCCRAVTFEELARKAAAAREGDRIPEAIDLYQQALQLKPSWAEGWFYLGTLFYDSDRYQEAQPAFEHFVKLDNKPAGWAFLGLCEFETGAYPQARGHLEKALRGSVAPEIEQVVQFHHALVLTRLGCFNRAAREYHTLVGRGIRNAPLIAGLGLNSLARPLLPGDTPTGEKEAVDAAGQTAYLWMKDDDAAASAFQAFLSAYPTTAGAHYFYATYLLNTRPAAALDECQRELELFPHSVEARALLALLENKSGNAGAAANAKQAVDDGPASPMAHYIYGLTLGDSKEAAAQLEISESIDPGNVEYHVALAHVYAELGRNDDARRERKLSVELASSHDAHSPN